MFVVAAGEQTGNNKKGEGEILGEEGTSAAQHPRLPHPHKGREFKALPGEDQCRDGTGTRRGRLLGFWGSGFSFVPLLPFPFPMPVSILWK